MITVIIVLEKRTSNDDDGERDERDGKRKLLAFLHLRAFAKTPIQLCVLSFRNI